MTTPKTPSPLNRRSFLQRTAALSAATAAAPYVITSQALGSDERAPASERVTVAHIGVGGQGGGLLNNFLRLSNAQSVATCDVYQKRREDAAQRIDAHYAAQSGKGDYKAARAYKDFRDVLARDDIDAVVIATPDHWHVPLTLAAARAGKDLYVEKPLGLTIEQDLAARKAVETYGVIFQYGTQQRSGRNFRYACELALNGRVGKIHTIHAWCAPSESGGSTQEIPVPEGLDYDFWLGPAPMAPYTQDRVLGLGRWMCYDYAIGFIAGWGAHPLDIAQWGLNTDDTGPIAYEGTGRFPTEGLYDTAIAWDVTCQYASGVVMKFMSTAEAKSTVEKYRPMHDHGTTFIGDEGWVSVDRSGIHAGPETILTAVIRPDEIHLRESNSHQGDFIDSVRLRRQPLSPIECAVRSDTISHLSDIAIRTKRKIKWDPIEEKILNDPQAERYTTRSMRPPWRL